MLDKITYLLTYLPYTVHRHAESFLYSRASVINAGATEWRITGL